MVRYLVPQDTSSTLRGAETLPCEHMGLLLTRYAPQEVIDRSPLPDNRYELWRDRWLKSICARIPQQSPALNALMEAQLNRWIATTEGASGFRMQALTRLIVGLGGKGTLEFGITLHHVSGLPYIPGSALKGLTRNYALLLIAAKQQVPVEIERLEELDAYLTRENNPDPDAILYSRIFGTQAEAGVCVFHDAILWRYPSGRSLFTVDVMTPHFVRYYRSNGKDHPNDSDQPNPVSFLAVNEGTQFVFAVGLRHGAGDNELRKQARRWLKEALREMGIGAKTAAGYGVFEALKDGE